ncbi:hypothetical protein AYI70_g853 [Smittium culicis]|uniref:Uncharacterized protein n=1 Tax=Smittium culicis TaxID=133412 RepID=A0A1R1YF39_9FUNG|nr:hypothetical protein AYI70_g853 [Smittium culicis]
MNTENIEDNGNIKYSTTHKYEKDHDENMDILSLGEDSKFLVNSPIKTPESNIMINEIDKKSPRLKNNLYIILKKS